MPVVLALAVDVVVIYMPAGQLVPALQSYWIAIHVTAMIIAIGTVHLRRRRHRAVPAGLPVRAAGRRGPDVARRPGSGTGCPARRCSTGWPTGRSCSRSPPGPSRSSPGAIWADHAWGRYWGWDPKETWSFITWLVYAAFLHARATAGWRGRRAAYIQLFGFACLLFNLVGVNLWITGLHSYAGMG